MNSTKINAYFVDAPVIPTQLGTKGIRYDFNDGARVLLPKGHWYVQLEDAQRDNILFGSNVDEGWVLSSKKYYIKHRIRVWDRDTDTEIIDHTLDLKDKPVIIKFPVGTIGDIVAWMPHADRFQRKHNCQLELTMSERMAQLFEKQYQNISFTYLPATETKTKSPYASYLVGLFFKGDTNYQPIDFRLIGLQEQAGYILGTELKEEAPKLDLGSPRLIPDRYVCVATKGSSQAKYWNNGYGWEEVIAYLKRIGYRVLCIDKERTEGKGFVWNRMPYGCEDFTGNKPLQERVALLEHADFFVGLGSGLSWLAWACHIPVVMISGFSLPYTEFYTPYRVFNPQGCNGCWNDTKCDFDHYDSLWCPKHKGTNRQFECSRLITGREVIEKIKQVIRDNNWLTPNGTKL